MRLGLFVNVLLSGRKLCGLGLEDSGGGEWEVIITCNVYLTSFSLAKLRGSDSKTSWDSAF